LKSSIDPTADGRKQAAIAGGEERPSVDILKGGSFNGNKVFAFRGLCIYEAGNESYRKD
jgi:hypothetical protein